MVFALLLSALGTAVANTAVAVALGACRRRGSRPHELLAAGTAFTVVARARAARQRCAPPSRLPPSQIALIGRCPTMAPRFPPPRPSRDPPPTKGATVRRAAPRSATPPPTCRARPAPPRAPAAHALAAARCGAARRSARLSAPRPVGGAAPSRRRRDRVRAPATAAAAGRRHPAPTRNGRRAPRALEPRRGRAPWPRPPPDELYAPRLSSSVK